MKKILLATLVVMAAAACTKDESFEGRENQPQEIKITSGISTRVSGDQWIAGDNIGVYGSYIYESSVSGYANYNNLKYTADQSGARTSFSLSEGLNPIYDDNNNGMSLVAYYPYNSQQSPYPNDLYIDLRDQSDLNAIDFMRAEATIAKGETEVDFSFSHQLSKVVLNVKFDDSIDHNYDLKFRINNVIFMGNPAASDSSRCNFGPIDTAKVVAGEDEKSYSIEMLLFAIPESMTNTTITFSIKGKQYTAPFNVALTRGKRHSFDVLLGTSKVEISGATIDPWDTDSIPEEDLEFSF